MKRMQFNLENAESIIRALKRIKENDGEAYCPCRPETTLEKHICPCFDARINERCCCGLFEFISYEGKK